MLSLEPTDSVPLLIYAEAHEKVYRVPLRVFYSHAIDIQQKRPKRPFGLSALPAFDTMTFIAKSFFWSSKSGPDKTAFFQFSLFFLRLLFRWPLCQPFKWVNHKGYTLVSSSSLFGLAPWLKFFLQYYLATNHYWMGFKLLSLVGELMNTFWT